MNFSFHSIKKSLAIWSPFLWALGISCSSQGPLVQGSVAPDFSFRDRSGAEHSLSQLRGKVVLLNFWATWCPPCVEEMPSMQQLQRRMEKHPFVTLAFSVEDNHSAIQRVEYSVDGNRWRAIYPKDGIPDSRRELFELPIQEAPGTIIIRASDAMNNVATATAGK